jgi:hypothetical protein
MEVTIRELVFQEVSPDLHAREGECTAAEWGFAVWFIGQTGALSRWRRGVAAPHGVAERIAMPPTI